MIFYFFRSNESIIYQTMDANWQKPDPDLATTTVVSNSTESTTPNHIADTNWQMPDPDLATTIVPSNSTETTTYH